MKTEIRNKINKEAIKEVIAETREELKEIKIGIPGPTGATRIVGYSEKEKRKGIQAWIDNNKRFIEIGIVIALYWTGSPGIATLMLLLYIIDTL